MKPGKTHAITKRLNQAIQTAAPHSDRWYHFNSRQQSRTTDLSQLLGVDNKNNQTIVISPFQW